MIIKQVLKITAAEYLLMFAFQHCDLFKNVIDFSRETTITQHLISGKSSFQSACQRSKIQWIDALLANLKMCYIQPKRHFLNKYDFLTMRTFDLTLNALKD